MSSALASLMASAFCSSAVAIASRQAFFLRRRQLGEFARRGFGLLRQLRHLFVQIHEC